MHDYVVALGGGNEIGASCYLLKIGEARLLIDAGMRLQAARPFPDFGPLDELIGGPQALDAVLITHAHLDHCGALARLHHAAPEVPGLATLPTMDLMSVMLQDTFKVGRQKLSEDYVLDEDAGDAPDGALAHLETIEPGRPLGRCGAGITALPAGHILGACGYLIEVGGRRILHTGDFCLHPQRTIPGAAFLDELDEVDVLIIESTYAHQPERRSETVYEQQYALAQLIGQAVADGGRVLVPAFALGRAQEIATLFTELFEQGVVAPFPVWLDGLARAVCNVYDAHRPWLAGRPSTSPAHAIYSEWVRPVPPGFSPQREDVSGMPPCCIISSSGMLLDGTRSAAYAEQWLPGGENVLAFSGYMDAESPGQRLANLGKGEKVTYLNGRPVDVRARVCSYHLSAHAQASDLQAVILRLMPKTVIFVHGDYQYDAGPEFLAFLVDLAGRGVQVHQAHNGVPVFI